MTLTGLLLERGTPQQLIEFIQSDQLDGYDKTLRVVYSVESWPALISDWRSVASSQHLRKLPQHSLPEANPNQWGSLAE